jgi:hypothetical protein
MDTLYKNIRDMFILSTDGFDYYLEVSEYLKKNSIDNKFYKNLVEKINKALKEEIKIK